MNIKEISNQGYEPLQNNKHEQFCAAYVNRSIKDTIKQIYLMIWPNNNNPSQSANNLMRKPHIKARIEFLQNNQTSVNNQLAKMQLMVKSLEDQMIKENGVIDVNSKEYEEWRLLTFEINKCSGAYNHTQKIEQETKTLNANINVEPSKEQLVQVFNEVASLGNKEKIIQNLQEDEQLLQGNKNGD